MSLILGVFDPHADRAFDQVARSMLVRALPSDEWRSALRVEGPVALGVSRPEWALKAGFAGPVFVVEDGDAWVAADATLYYRDDLRRRMLERGVRPTGQTPSHLIAAAYRAWGERCAEYLEGDFAFVVWDRRARQFVSARDFAGKRPLHFAELPGGGIAFASSIEALLAHPRCSAELDLAVIAESMAAYIRPGGETCYAAIKRLETGRTAVRGIHRALRIVEHWTPPHFEQDSRVAAAEAALELRQLLARAAAERSAPNATTAVWMSGGRDSTAVFASAMAGVDGRGASAHVVPISVSYPEGDPGREDEYIEAVARHWNSPVHWVDIQQVPLLDDIAHFARSREEPFAHVFESPLRALARAGRHAGAVVALDGVGGDQLFSVSSVYFSDLLRTGQWRTLAREWRDSGMGSGGVRTFVRWAVQPTVPTWALHAAGALRGGRPLRGELRRRVPEWVHPGFAQRHRLAPHTRALPRRRRGESVSSSESRWYLSDPLFPAIHGAMAKVAAHEAVEVRSPLMDARVVAFSATRPRQERCDGGRTKLLLRAAMQGLLPTEVLAEREARTGVTGGIFARALREIHATVMLPLLRDSQLVQLGIVDGPRLLQAADRYARTNDEEIGLRLLLTLHTELWLRHRHETFPPGINRSMPRDVPVHAAHS